MIQALEIQRKARKIGVRDTQIEKDYILSWILYQIYFHLIDIFLIFASWENEQK
jgi:predicted nucleotidyltransferase component of viral defense system